MVLLGGKSNKTLIACVADGAGSCKKSDRGSAIASDTIIQCASSHFAAKTKKKDLDRDEILDWCNTARSAIREDADRLECDTREFATTLCVAIAAKNRSIFFQIGDGAIILRSGGVFGVVFWPQSGEYANTTNFLTGDNYQDHLQFQATSGNYSDLALMTDGIERLALNFDTMTPHPPFFEPLFGALRTTDDSEALGEDLRGFLQSEHVRDRSDDDKSLILASRF